MNCQRLAILLCLPLALNGCAAAIIGAGAGGAAVVAQERSVGSAVDDNTIYLHIKSLFAQGKTGDMFANVIVKVSEGSVLLTGNVDEPESQVEAVRLAWTVAGVKEVINEIQVNSQAGFGNYMRDAWISNQIRSRLVFTKNIRSLNYSVVTVNQVVYLMGIAQDQAELERATSIASTTSYVKQVVSHVRLKNDPRRQ